ncbi:MAG: hypothetical protein LJF06_03735 [Gemmatimonadetes bacterium]|jgi:hypothetical protein|nr:hypothetical protein [Gemmatimonadota bacterium]
MITKSWPFKRLVRRAYATLMAMAVVAIASGCATREWVPLTQAPPMGDKVWLKVEPPSDSASAGTRYMILYHARMEDDSVLVGTPVQDDTAMTQQERVQVARAFVVTEQPPPPLAIMAVVLGAALAVAMVVVPKPFK